MSNYYALDDDGDDYTVISDATEAVHKCTRRLTHRVGILSSKDSPALRQQIEEEYKKGQGIISNAMPQVRNAANTQVRRRQTTLLVE